jgi:hypothetical protein
VVPLLTVSRVTEFIMQPTPIGNIGCLCIYEADNHNANVIILSRALQMFLIRKLSCYSYSYVGCWHHSRSCCFLLLLYKLFGQETADSFPSGISGMGQRTASLRYFLHHVMVRKEINDMAYS